MKDHTNRELLDLIDQSLNQTAKDVREGRIPLDGRARMPLPEVGTRDAERWWENSRRR